MVMHVESVNNPLIEQAAQLHQKKHRDAQGILIVEGLHPLEEARKAGLTIFQCFTHNETTLNELIEPILPRSAECEVLRVLASEAVMEKLSSTHSAPPCIATIAMPETPSSLNDFLEHISSKSSVINRLLVLDRLQDPGNLGTLIRSAIAFGVSGILLTDDTVDPYSSKVIRASAGLVFALPILRQAGTLSSILETLIQHKVTPVLTQSDESAVVNNYKNNHYKKYNYNQPTALVLGNEGAGIAFETIPQAIRSKLASVAIPMQAGVESLNVSICGSILMAEAASQVS